MKAKSITLRLPADLAAHVEGVDGRKVPAMIFAALRAQWVPQEPRYEQVDSISVPVWGSIPADRKAQ